MDENSVPGCEFCSEQRPSLTCSDCSLNLCESCCSQVHSKGKLAEHKLTPYSCEVCSKIRSEVDCYNCDVGFCAPCFSKLHSRGTMALHVRAPREPVDAARQAMLEGLPGQLPPQLGSVPSNTDAAAASAAAVLSSVAQQTRSWTSPTTAAPSTTAGPSTSIFCDGTCKTCPPAHAKTGYGLSRFRKESGKDGEGGDDTEPEQPDDMPQQPPRILEPVNLALLPCQHRVNQRLFSYRKTGDGWVGREVVGNIFTDYQNQSQLQFEVREDGIFCNICPPHRAPFSTSGDVSNLRSHAKSDLHLNHLTLRLTGQWPSCKPTGILSDGSFTQSPAKKPVPTVATITPVPEVFTPPHGNKGFRSPKQLYTPGEQELLQQLGEECNWSKRNNALIEKFAEQHNMLPRRVKAWIGNHKPTRKKYRYSSSGAPHGEQGTPPDAVSALNMPQTPTFSVAATGADGVPNYTVSNAIALGNGQTTTTVTLLSQLPIPGEVVLPEAT